MFIPFRKTAELHRPAGTNGYGEHQYVLIKKHIGWAPIYMRDDRGKSPVRADSSASKGRADQTHFDYRLILDRFEEPKKDDRVVLDNDTVLRVRRVHQRMDIVGRLHHWEIECDAA